MSGFSGLLITERRPIKREKRECAGADPEQQWTRWKYFRVLFTEKFSHGKTPVGPAPAAGNARNDYNNLIARTVFWWRNRGGDRGAFSRAEGKEAETVSEELLSFVRLTLWLTDAQRINGRPSFAPHHRLHIIQYLMPQSTRKWNSKTRKIKSGDFLYYYYFIYFW